MPNHVRLPLLCSVIVAALAAGVHGGASSDDAVQLQLGTLLFEETRYAEALQAFRRAVDSDDRSISVPARIGVVRSALRIGSSPRRSGRRSPQGRGLVQSRGVDRPRRRAVVGGQLRRGRGADARRWRWCLACRARCMASPGPRPAQPARRGDEHGAGGAEGVAARPGDSPHRRRHLGAHASLRAGRGRLHELHRPAAEQGPQREGRLVARAGPLPPVVRGARAPRPRRSGGPAAAHRALPARGRQGHRQGARQRPRSPGLRARHRLRADDGLAADGVTPASGPSPTR